MTIRKQAQWFLTALLCVATIHVVHGAAGDLLWSDEFNYTGAPDPTIWTHDVGNNDGWGNKELQTYTSDSTNSLVQDGNLVIIARRDGATFTSARIKTEKKVTYTYGTLVARMKVPNVVAGLWPAFWTMGENALQVGWPSAGEVDIMEMGQGLAIEQGLGNQRVVSAAHWDIFGQYATYARAYDSPTDLTLDYHEFKFEWTPDSMITYVDDKWIWELDITETQCPSCNELHQPHYILFNMAVGGGFTSGSTSSSAAGGSSSCQGSSSGVSSSGGCPARGPDDITAPLPAELKVDWVRLFDNGFTQVTLPPSLTPVVTTYPTAMPVSLLPTPLPSITPTISNRQPLVTPLPTPLPTPLTTPLITTLTTSQPTLVPVTLTTLWPTQMPMQLPVSPNPTPLPTNVPTAGLRQPLDTPMPTPQPSPFPATQTTAVPVVPVVPLAPTTCIPVTASPNNRQPDIPVDIPGASGGGKAGKTGKDASKQGLTTSSGGSQKSASGGKGGKSGLKVAATGSRSGSKSGRSGLKGVVSSSGSARSGSKSKRWSRSGSTATTQENRSPCGTTYPPDSTERAPCGNAATSATLPVPAPPTTSTPGNDFLPIDDGDTETDRDETETDRGETGETESPGALLRTGPNSLVVSPVISHAAVPSVFLSLVLTVLGLVMRDAS